MFALVALAVTPLMMLTIVLGAREQQHALQSAQASLRGLANLAAANEAQSIERAMQILRDLSSVPAVTAGGSGCGEILSEILGENPAFVNFGLIEMNGDVSCSAVASKVPVNLGDRAHFKRAVAERRFIAGNYIFGRVIQKHTVNLTYPVVKRGQVDAVLFAAIDLGTLDRFIDDVKLPAGSLLLTLDEEGQVISRRPTDPSWFGKKIREADARIAATASTPAVFTDDDGVSRLYASAKVGPASLSNYTVLIGVPEGEILGGARRSQLVALAGLGMTLLLAALAAWWGAEVLILRRLRSLGRAANSIASGSLSTRTGIAHGREEISQLARALDEMAHKLEQREIERDRAEAKLVTIDRRKDEFLAMLAHELRNPLAPISAGAQVLQRIAHGDALVARTAAIIARQATHMTRLIDDLLDVSRVTRGLVVLELESVDMTSLVNDAIEQVRPMIMKKRQRLKLELTPDGCRVNVDQKRMIQVIANLLNNAAKYTQAEGVIEIELACSERSVQLSVTDNGIGMGPELLPQVFDLFAQGETSSDRAQGGLGIGLSLVKSLAQLHGGSVSAYSAGPGTGSRFVLALPRSNDSVPAPAVRRAPAPGDSGLAAQELRCLVVDDNADAAHTLQMLLEELGHKVAIAHDAAGAIALADTLAPHVCLLDIGLPGTDGNELVRRLKSTAASASATMIAVSGYGRTEDQESSLAAGFDHYFVKPLDTAALLALLASLPGRQVSPAGLRRPES
ncbi:MAG: ATP-binding protein [Telluria sp.]